MKRASLWFASVWMALISVPALAANIGFVCTINSGPFDGGLASIQLALSEKGTYVMTYSSAKHDGSRSKEIVLGRNLDCTFSSRDPFVAYCLENSEALPAGRTLRSALQSTKNIKTLVLPEVDTTITDYELVVAAPTVSDDILGSIDPMGFNAKNKSLRLQVNLSQNGLSGCKAL